MKRKLKNIICIVICCAISSLVCFPTHAVTENKKETETKVFSTATLNDDFADDSVLVVLKKDYGKINSSSYKNIFSNFACDSITDLTRISKRAMSSDRLLYIEPCKKLKYLMTIN